MDLATQVQIQNTSVCASLGEAISSIQGRHGGFPALKAGKPT